MEAEAVLLVQKDWHTQARSRIERQRKQMFCLLQQILYQASEGSSG